MECPRLEAKKASGDPGETSPPPPPAPPLGLEGPPPPPPPPPYGVAQGSRSQARPIRELAEPFVRQVKPRVRFESRPQGVVRDAATALDGSKKRPRLAAPCRATAAPPSTVLPSDGDAFVPPEAARGHILYRAGEILGCTRCGSFSAKAARSDLYGTCDPQAPVSSPRRRWRRDNFASGRHPSDGRKHPIPMPRRLQVSDPAVQWLGLLQNLTP